KLSCCHGNYLEANFCGFRCFAKGFLMYAISNIVQCEQDGCDNCPCSHQDPPIALCFKIILPVYYFCLRNTTRLDDCLMENTKPTYSGAGITDHQILDKVPENYRRLLHQMNGFIWFDGGLHVRGAVLSPSWHSLREVWSGDFALHKLY